MFGKTSGHPCSFLKPSPKSRFNASSFSVLISIQEMKCYMHLMFVKRLCSKKGLSFTLVGVQIVVFCVVTHSVVGGYENSGGTCCPHLQGRNK